MIIEFLINLLVGIIKLPIALLHIPQVNIQPMVNTIAPYLTSGYSFITFFLDDFALTIVGIALASIALFKMVDIIATIVGFFKKTGD